MVVMIFLFILLLKLEVAKYHNLLSVKISTLQDVFTRIIQTGNKYSTQIHSNALVSHGNKTRGSTSHDKSGKNHEIWEVVCYYYHELDHTKRYCQKLQEKARRTEMTHSGNSYKFLFSNFKAYTLTPNIIFTDGSTSCVLRSGTLTRALNYCVSSFFLLIISFKILRRRKLLVEVMSMEDIMYLMHKC
ncbi:hypothetical protein ERO13_D09G054350v2 [Gossypium hirsutum]|nr:hypothetical protein ERO13_D09G054350v2 [Gossypium hirsutum]